MLKVEGSFSVGEKQSKIDTDSMLSSQDLLWGTRAHRLPCRCFNCTLGLKIGWREGQLWREPAESKAYMYFLWSPWMQAGLGFLEAWPVCLEAEKQEEKWQCSAKRPREEFSRNSTSLQSLSPQSSPNHQRILIQQRCICSILSPKCPSLCWNNSRV